MTAAQTSATIAEDAVATETHPDGTFMMHGKLWVYMADGSAMPLDLVKTETFLEDQMVRKIIGFAKPLSEQIARFKKHTRADIAQFDEQLEAKYGLVKRGRAGKGNQQYKTLDGMMMVETRTNDVTEFGPQLQVAKRLIDECLVEWVAEGRAEIQAIVTRAFNTDQAGKINKNAVIALTKIDSDDPRWKQAVDAIHEAVRVIGTKERLSFSFKNSPDGDWITISINIADA